MRNRFIATSVALAGVMLLSTAAVAQERGGRGRGGQGGQEGVQGRGPTRAEQGRGEQRPIPCVNEWQLPNGCDPARARPAEFDPKNLSGVWILSRGSTNMGDDILPMTPLGRQRQEANRPSVSTGAFPVASYLPRWENDPMGKCDPLGLTRNVFLEVGGRAMEFVHTPDRVLQFFEWAHGYRTIWTDGRALPVDPNPRWMGYSVGRWEGDTFVVDTVGLDERTWADMRGRPRSDANRTQERYRRVDRETLELVMRIEDPKIFTAPWVSDTRILRLRPEKGMDERLETFCVPSEEEAFNQGIRDPAAGMKR